MEVKIKYFGSIAEETGKAEETINLQDVTIELQDLKSFILSKYKMDEDNSIQIALNQALHQNGKIKNGDEVAFLPPYAGG